MRVELPDYTGLANEYIKAGMEMGYSKADLNGHYSEGKMRFDLMQITIGIGIRYYRPLVCKVGIKDLKFQDLTPSTMQ